VVDSLEAHPITEYVNANVPVTVNTDNRLFSRTSVTEELWRVYQHCDISVPQLREIALNGFRYAFLPFSQKQELLRDMINDFPLDSTQQTPLV
jgi:adenosine deaminase